MKRMTIDLPIISEKVGIMLEYLEKHFEDFRNCKKEYDEALTILEKSVGSEKVEALKRAIFDRTAIDILFSESLGYQANLENFRNPKTPPFYESDFEVYLKQEEREDIPARRDADENLNAFLKALTDDEVAIYVAIQEYTVYLECDIPKFAHYWGYLLANKILPFTEPGYKVDLIHTSEYGMSLCKWFEVNPEDLIAE